MTPLPLRLRPGDDLRRAIEAAVLVLHPEGAFVACGIGSLSSAVLRLAGAAKTLTLAGEFEILSLAGSVSADGSHLHISIADADGRVLGGHAGPGCIVRTTAEILVLPLGTARQIGREFDAATGYPELVIRSCSEEQG
ncbi:MAG: DNA-binding protein [Paucibacter sp.]|nr:DNA-binding protein [Roseateles sp.]